REFADAFAQCGLKPNVVTPSYGLAESTLLVSASLQAQPDAIAPTRLLERKALAADCVEDGGDAADAISLVGAGEAAAGSEIAIVDAQTLQRQGANRIGEIWVRGPSVAAGYWMREEESQQAFGARIADSGPRYLRTGDLGFLDDSGQLYVAGRLKEMMIFSGENVYPQDIEATVEAQDAAFRADGCAAFSVEEESGNARLVIVQELETRGKPDTDALVGKLRLALYERHGITELAAVLLVKAGQLPRTSSGKIQRVQCRQLWQDGAFAPVWQWREGDPGPQAAAASGYAAPATPTEAALAQIWQELLGADSVSVEADFLALGGHSLLAGQIAAQVRDSFGVELELQALFDAPTVRALAGRIDELIAVGSVADDVPLMAQPSPASGRGRESPLSLAQRRLWFLDQYTPGDPANNIAVAVQLTGPLRVPALEAALNAVVARHETLRTRFGSDAAGEPVQIIEPQLRIALPVQDADAAQAQALAAAEALAPFDLRQGPLLRARLLRQGADDHLLLVTVHHIVSDGWSMGVLAREVSALYAAQSAGAQATPLPPLAVQYADYASWQRQWLQGPVLQRQLDYWRAQLADAPALLTLPTDRPRPQVRSQAGASLPFALDAATTGALRALCQAQGATLFMGLLAGFSLLLARFSGQRDLCVGTFAANRTRAEVEPLVGFFLNTLVLRTRLAPGDDFAGLLRQVRDTTLQAYAHQHLPFEQLLEAVRPDRATSYTPLFQAMLVLQNIPDTTLALPGVQARTLPLATVGAKTDLVLELWEQPGAGLSGRLEYSTDLFDAGTIERLGARLRLLLQALAARPAAALWSHDLLQADEHRQLAAWNATGIGYPRDIATVRWFEQRAHAHPDATALVFQDESLGYGELNARANRLAHWLRAQGVGPDVLVGLCMPRGMQAIVAVLGILKAGGAYLPLDPDYPAERLAFMLEDARPALVITQQALRDRLPPHGLPVLDPDAQAGMLAALPDTDPPVAADPRNLAYVIYTSGSTGKPKGVAIAQRNLNSQAAALGRQYGIVPGDRMLQFAALSFDMSVEEIFGALLHGAALVLRDDSWLTGPREFAALCERNGITMANLPTGFWRYLVNAPDFQPPACLRQVMVGGEAALPADMQAWFSRFAHVGLLNSYGPTETTVNATSQRPTADPASWPSIGGPIGNTRIHVLDAHLNPVPVGIAGEIYVGGEGVARGYLGRAALTAERFVPEPFGAAPGARMYRTGDLARWRADGTIEFLGRADHQVKIRGFRIELGEIEAALAAQPGVREALVLAREDTPGNARLVAYAAPQEGHTLAVAQLRDGLAQSLPDYMVPALFVLLPAFPLLPNGKIDRKALPAPDLDALASEAYEAPVGAREQAIAAAWAQALGLPRVGRNDNFFTLGGHSLLAVGLVEALRRRGVATELRSLFTHPTVAALAAQGQARQQPAPVPALPPMAGLDPAQIASIAASVPGGMDNVQDIYPLAPLQEGILFHHRMGGEGADQGDVYLLRSVMVFDGRAHLDRFLQALQAVIDRHDVLRTALRWEGLPRPVQVVHRQATLPVTELPAQAWDPSTPEGEPPRALLDAADPARVRLDLRQAPLLATWVLDGGTGPCWLALLIHHTVSDHVTVQLVLQEVHQLLQDKAKDLPPALPYRDFVAQALAVPDSVHAAYFRGLLGDVDEPTAPFGVLDVHGGNNGDGVVAEARFALPETLAQSVRALARRHGMTPAVLFHLAWAQLVARTSGRDDVVFGTLLMGRSHGVAGADRMLGLFINTLPLRLTLAGRSVVQALAQVQEHLGELVAHEQAPLALAQRASGVAAPAPLFSSLLNFRHGANQDGRIAWAGMRVARYEERTNYPLALAVDDLGGDGFALTAHVQGMPVEPERICAYMATAVQSLVALLEQAPHTPVRELQVVPEPELHRQLVEWNASTAPYPRDGTVAQQFERQVRIDGDAVAVVFEGERLSRAELNARANRLAHHLRGQGVGPDVLVGVCMEPGIDLIAGLLAVLKAGGAYLPLDPAYPAERLAHMLQDARPAVVLTHAALQGALPARHIPARHIPVFRIDQDWAMLDAQPDTDPAPRGGPDNLAYAIYTSGSTGRPKGVAVPRHSVMNILAHIRRVPGPLPEGPASMWASISFDPAVQEIFTALTTGAPLHIVPAALRGDPALLVRWLAEHRIVQAFLPPAIVRWATEAPRRFAGLHLRRLATGVESLSEEGLWTLQQLLPGLRIEDGYGPTEATLYASSYTEMRPLRRTVPIGRPVSNARLYLLDAALRSVPAGVVGEVFIAGAGLARGYLNRPDLTAERFLPDPFGAPGTRMYRTGDLAHHLPDGNLVFAGRADQQVKIRGFRVEPGEIEAQLAAWPQVAQALVVAREEASGDKQLVAYVTPREGQDIEVQALRAALARRLPGYMVPSHIVVLAALPLTPNGKIDRKALPVPDAAQAQEAYVAPRTPLERGLAAVWAAVLGLERVGIHDNFFELGGHSLLATRVVSQVGVELGMALPLRELFQRPKLEDLAAFLESQAVHSQVPIAPVARPAGGLPLSYAQQRLWFLQELERGDASGEGASYNIPMALRLRGDGVSVDLLEEVFNALAERHETLRTVFQAQDGQPRQLILPRLHLAVGFEDLGALDAKARQARTQTLMDAEAAAPFDLNQGPLLRVGLLRLAPREHVVLLTLHHIVSDGWSMGVLVDEVVEIFTARREGRPARLTPLTIQYADYAAWQRAHLQGEHLRLQLRYWRGQLQGAPALLELPTDRPRPALQSHRGASHRFVLPQALVHRLRALGQARGATLFMVLHSAFAVLLHRHSGQDDICVGTPIAGRNRAELEGLIGFFVNTLVLRNRIDPHAGFDALLEQSREVALGAYAHQELPFEQLVEELNPQRSLSHSPLFQVMFALQNAPGRKLEIPGLEVEMLTLQAQAARFDLTCSLAEDGDRLQGSLDYNADLFDKDTMVRLAGHYQVLLAGICDAPGTPVEDLPLLAPAERQQLLVEWNDTAAPYRHDTAIHQLFEEQAARMPDATALVDAQVSLSYGELNARANQLARRLRAMGVGPERLVGICMQRGHELVVGLLAVLKAGGAYLPLDPDYPAERLAYMLGDAKPAVLLTTCAVRPELVEGLLAWASTGSARTAPSSAQTVPGVLCLDRDWAAQVAGEAMGNLPNVTLPHNLAYVIYTSGSTGQPKGVGVSGRNLSHIVANWCRSRGALPGEAASLWSSISFDASVHELFVPLATGQALHVVPQDLRGDPEALMDWMRAHRIAQAFLPPAFVRWLIDKPERIAGLQLRHLAVGVEPLPEDGLWRLEQALPGLRIANGYGPTEATIYATEYAGMQPLRRQCPVGTPIANTQLYLLDAALQPVALGVTGEVFIAGDGLARGYLKRPGLTAERFVPNPFGPPGTRMYRTGDLARRLADGNLQFAGRADHQVKVRGFRVEPGEVEAQLLAQPQLAQALVVARADSLGENQLVAYVAPRDGQAVDVEAVRAALGRALPVHMVPSHIVPLPALPLNANGKVDRDALPAPQALRAEADHVAPRTPLEQELAGIWEDVLGVERVGVHDNFFSLGGHSLLATQAVSRLRARFAGELPLQALFEEPTVAGMAVRIGQMHPAVVHDGVQRQEEGGDAGPPLVRVPHDQPLALSFAQQRLWFLQELEPGNPFYNMPVAVRMRGALDVAALQATLDEVVRRHEALRTRFVTIDGTAHQQVAYLPTLALARDDLSGVSPARREAEMRARMQQEAHAPFDLVAGPPVRARLVRLDAAEHLVLLTVHHIVSDGWSMGVLLREIGALYAAFAQGAPSSLPELPVQYADFAHWQRQVLSGAVLERQVAYWKHKLADAPELLALPTDRPRPPVQSHRGDTHDFAIAPAVANGLRGIALRAGGTLFMPLTAALNALLARYSGQRDVCIGTAIANRTRGELEPMIGFFVNTLVLRTRMEDDPGFEELVGQVRRTALEAYAHQDIPFEHLVDVLAPERHLDRTPLFQVMVVLQNAPMGTLALPQLTLAFEPVHSKTAKCDLTFFFVEDGERIQAHIEYSTDLFERPTIERMARHFLALLEAAVAQPRTRISQLPLMDAAERGAVLAAGEGERFAVDGTLHQLFEAQALRSPDAVALVHGQQRLSYAQLDARANQLACRLRQLGVGPEVLVALCIERGLDMVVGLLGILKAGGAYVPLDPAYPAARLAYMLGDAKPAVLLTTSATVLPELVSVGPESTPVRPELVEGLSPAGASTGSARTGTGAGSTRTGQDSQASHMKVLCLDRDWDAQVATQPAEQLPNLAQPQNLAYMIYTSGSTGQPKGTQIPHRAVVNLLATMAHSPGMQADDVLLAVTSLSFDIAALEIFLPLAKGASIVLASREQAADAQALKDLARTHAVTVMQATPSTWRMLHASDGPVIRLRLALCGGEAMDAPLAKDLCGMADAAWNVYGPTETTVWSSRDWLSVQRPVTLGRPIANTQFHILDEHLNLVPRGVAGELHIGGEGLARGYLHRPALTAEKFVANPYGEAGSRLYKTGDLARWLPDGNVEYLGRIDQQVKLRGFRIELGEIEAVLRALPIVREAAVAMRGDVPGEERLVAYVATNTQADEAARQLEAEQSGHWSRIWEQIYGESSAPQDAMFNIAGWNSSFDRQPIPAEEMEEWVAHTVGRILELQPRKVLEIGCGTGLLLHRIALACAQYWGMDFSATVLEQLRASLDAHPAAACDVRLLHREANDFDGVEPLFDTVVINSVAQYFPNLDYLTQVLEGAIRTVGATGRIFVGDVRNHRLFDAFNASLALHGARPSDSIRQIQRMVAARRKTETELLVDPSYFFALKARLPQVAGLKILLKPGQAENELTKFRYDVVIEVGELASAPASALISPDWRGWDAFPQGLAAIETLLAHDRPDCLAIQDIPDARVEEEIAAAECLQALEETAKVAELRSQLRALPRTGVHADALARLCARHGYQVQICLAGEGRHAFHAVVSARPMAVDWSALHARLAATDAVPFSNRPVSAHLEALVRQAILAHAKRELPAYMVPANVVLLDALPLTPNGKLDRKALPAPQLRRGEADYVAPRTPAEDTVARIWAEVLGLDRVGIHDNFFELGGHSLLATRVIARIRTQLGAELPLRVLFEASTVAELAPRIAQASGGNAGRTAAPIVPVPRDRPVPLSYAQNRFWFLEQYQPGVLSFSMPVALTLAGEWDGARLAHAFDALVARHEPLRTTFSHRAGVPEQVIAAPSPLHLRVDDVTAPSTEAAQAAVDDAMRQEAATPFDLTAGPLWRVRLLKTGAAEHVLLLTLHHILYDAWSLRVLIEEMMQLYRGQPLPQLPVHYADYCHWERAQLDGPVLQEQLGYWKGALAGAPDLLPLPTDRPRPATMTYAGRIHRAALSPALTQRLSALGNASRATLFMVMAAAFKALFHRLSGQQDLTIGSLTANRSHGTESLIGIFANIVVLRSTVDADSSFAQVLDATAQQVLAAHDHPLPFELVLTHMVESRDPSYMPYAQVVLNFYDELEGTLDGLGSDEGLRIAGRPNALGAQADFQLKVDMRLVGGRLDVDYIYNTDLFDEATVARWHGHLEQLAEAAAARPQARMSQLPLLDAAQQGAILAACNDARHYDVDGTLHGLFEAQAARRPQAIALTHEER
ncbi:non-ribosomal peptide synthetase, partial [Ramlibacter sp.]|uniref:non-ribosomal peptide synthetase n=1 Tax=Ramlibacter sp. TaxID=1917967 RepID=UPI0017CAA8F9